MSTTRIPPGYVPMPLGPDFNSILGPFYGGVFEAGLRMGTRLDARHLNALGTAHGGAVAAIADMQGLLVQQIAGYTDRVTPTVSLSIDFIGRSQADDWLDIRPRLLKATRSLLFCESHLFANDELIARSSAVFKIGPVTSVPWATLGTFFADRFPGSVPVAR